MSAYTGSDLEGDLARAFLARWQTIAALVASFPGGIGQEPLPATPSMPYATLDIEQGSQADEHTTGEQQVCYRDIVVKVRSGSKEEALQLGGMVSSKFNATPPTFTGLMRFEPGKGKIETPRGDRVQGSQVHLATVRFTAWIHWNRTS